MAHTCGRSALRTSSALPAGRAGEHPPDLGLGRAERLFGVLLARDRLLHGDAREIADLAPELEARAVVGLCAAERAQRQIEPLAASDALEAPPELGVLPDRAPRRLAGLE